ncbi:hypothetical protein [Yeosuana marina]|uniref:hypothetical protein n=1 Tax=Yeosuana marina TaxID=1565536 RepID=UPI0014211B61|nr:hypothetical protein [Yeosuana marina]
MTDDYIKLAKKIASNFLLVNNYYPTSKSNKAKYAFYQIMTPFVKAHYKLFNFLYPQRPWTSPASIIFFDRVLKDDMVGLEYGSGRSTLYFSKRIKKLVSIEHNEEWYKLVQNRLKENNIENVDYFLFPKEHVDYNKDDLDIYLNEHDEQESKKTFEKYYNKVNDYPDGFFDFVIIDGRARVRSGLNSIDKLKSGGIFVLDNSERERYNPLHEALESWLMVKTTNGITNTTIWVKP